MMAETKEDVMSTRLITLATIAFVELALVTPPSAQAQLWTPGSACQRAVVKQGGRFVDKKLKIIQKCNDRNLRLPGSCTDLPQAIAKLEDKAREGIVKGCAATTTFGLYTLGYACLCGDPDPMDGFTVDDLADCIVSRHELAVDDLVDFTYGTTMGLFAKPVLDCQSAIAKAARQYAGARLKLIAKCRDAINIGKIVGLAPEDCATGDPKTAAGIAKARDKALGRITQHCTDEEIAALDLCPIHVQTVGAAEACILDAYDNGVDGLIGIEYASPSPSPFCGDGVRNTLDEECDAGDDADCPGACGAPAGDFPCLCLTIPRQRVIEHGDADLDLGSGAQDMGLPEGRYLVDLYDCDPSIGDFDCTVGPSCSDAPHTPCANDAECASLGEGTCRKRRTAVGPHCNLDVQVACTSGAQCPGCGNFCVKELHGPPLPVLSGGIAVCNVNVFADDVVGTTNVGTGATRLRIHQHLITYLGATSDQPCPVCGGFCAGPLSGGGGPGARTRCTTDADCPNTPNRCVTNDVCSYGPNADQHCRPDPPFGGVTELYGTTSVDCLPLGAPISGPSGFDLLFDATTDTVTLPPTVECDDPAFSGERCVGGANAGRPCTSAADCPDGSCNEQCFCATGNVAQEGPNFCAAACVSTGADDGHSCTNDADCPTGFCHPADCRADPHDPDSAQEGHCTVAHQQQCFVNGGIIRAGAAGAGDRTLAAIFCVPPSSSAALNNATGLPGPGALTQPVTVISTGF
jgi:hypothetical protein